MMALNLTKAPLDRCDLDYSSLLNALPHPVVLTGTANSIEFANSAAEDFFCASQRQLTRSALDQFVPFGSPLLSLIELVQRNGTAVNEYGVDLGTPRTSTQQLVDIYVSPMPERPGSTLVVLQQRSMAQMIERQLSHRGAARSVSGLASVLAHEIKNPLSGIRGAAQLLESSVDEQDRQLTRLICEETERICTLVDRMQVFGDERSLVLEPQNIHSILDHVKTLAKSGFAGHIRFIEQYDPSLPPVPGSRDLLIQVFLNLVKNAAEAIGRDRTDGIIALSTAFRPGVRLSVPGSQQRTNLPLEISVEDNGPGVSRELLPHLFDPFVTTKPSGTGLGLALVAKIVGDHGGVIECESRERRTVFRVLMPLTTLTALQAGAPS